MRVFLEEIRLKTREKRQLVDMTEKVEEVVRKSKIKSGLCLVYAPHATAAIIVNERESGLMNDILRKVEEDFPEGGSWLHNRIDDNAAAHLASSFLSSFAVFPVVDGEIYRGTWQNIFLLELDGPRRVRKVLIQVLGE